MDDEIKGSDDFLESLDKWAGFADDSRSPLRRQLVYGAWGLFLVSLFLPAIYEGPVLTAGASRYLGGMAWLLGCLGVVMVPIGLFEIVGGLIFEAWQKSVDFGNFLLFVQLTVHALGNFLLLAAAWVRLEERGPRLLLYVCTFLAMSIVVNPVYDIGKDLLIGYYVWVAAHILLTISTFVK